MYFGATAWAFSWAPPYDEAIKTVARLGFKSVGLPVWDESFLTDYYTPETNKKLKKLIEDEGLILSEVFCIPMGQASTDPAERAASVDYFKRVLEVAEQLGAKNVNALTSTPFELDFPFEQTKPTLQEWTAAVPKGLDWKQNWKDFIEVMKEFAKACEEKNMTVSFEPHPHRMMHNSASMQRMIEQIDSEAIGLNLDPSHLFPMGEMPHVVAYEVGDRVFHTHFSDNDAQTNAHWRPGKGKIDWRALLIALDDIGYDGPISLELEDVPGAAGYPGFHRSPDSIPELLEKEYLQAKEYLMKICEEEGIKIEK